MELNAIEFLNTAPLHNNHSLYTKHPPWRRNCPIKICLLEDVSHYRPSGSLWSSLQPIIWSSSFRSHSDQKGLALRSGISSVLLTSILTVWEANRKLTFGRCLGASPLSSTSESGDTASDLYHGNNDLYLCQELRGLPRGARHLWRHVTVFGGESLHSALW